MNKQLIITLSLNDSSKFKKIFCNDFDVLAITQDVMMKLDDLGISYKVTEDYYNEISFINDRDNFNEQVNSLFEKLDLACQPETNFPYSYSGNEHYLLTWLDDSLYLEELINLFDLQYDKIYLFADKEPKKLSNNYLSIFELNSKKVNGTISLPLERSISKKIQIIYSCIDMEFIRDLESSDKKIPLLKNILLLIRKAENFIRRRKRGQQHKSSERNLNDNSKVFVVQDGYEVLYLKKYLPTKNYISDISKLRDNAIVNKPKFISISLVNNTINDFASKNFNFLQNYIKLVLFSFHLEVVGRIRSFQKKCENLINLHKPTLMLFSYGTRDVFDSIIAFEGNQHKVPLVFFQHGGHSEFFLNPYQECIENNPKISKKLILQSISESKCLPKHHSELLHFGSISQNEMYTSRRVNFRSKEILFCLGPDANFNFRHLLNFYSSDKKYKASCDVLSAASSLTLKLDVKLHPTGEVDSFFFYKDFIRKNNYKFTNILYGNFGEGIANQYNLIIFDFIGTALINFVLTIDVCVIIYHKNFENLIIKDSVKNDLRSRCYIAENKNELESLFLKYKEGKLPTKWTESFIDKYIFPFNNSIPGKEIAKFVNNL